MNQVCVAKFGGTSVANAEAMSRCAQVVVNNPKTRVIVLSASAGVTNLLVELSQGTLDAAAALRKEVMDTVDKQLGAIARPGQVHFVTLLPKTRSGKLLRRSIQALAEGRDPGDLTTIEDPAALEQIRVALAGR